MKHFDTQSATDLEFDLIRLMLHDLCGSQAARDRMVDLGPIRAFKDLSAELGRVHEFHTVRTEGYSFPRVQFEEFHQDLELLDVPDSMLSQEGFVRIYDASNTVNDVLKFFKGCKGQFPGLEGLLEHVYHTTDITQAIDKVFDRHGKVRDDASPELASIRSSMTRVRRVITRNFNKVLKHYRDQGWLGDTQEAFLHDRRLLAIKSTHKRQVPGMALGASKQGTLTYIEPQENVPFNHELEMLRDDERSEINRILRALTAELRSHALLIKGYLTLLIELDVLQAKTKLAIDMEASLPGISKEPVVDLKNAYHPLLLLTNRKAGLPTKPQSVKLEKGSRMLVISGPNAGGKSITLKTIGLLQVMLQSGLLIPADPSSTMSFFHAVLSDIGDNQSIENQLSTYSYRLKRMKHFLDVANPKSLLLLDEFGTGSDPELGGALAEVFFERLYQKGAFAVITTHYANIKMKAANLKNAFNGCMLFDTESLEPLYKLSVGQPGSSFTFEVAEINGIDPEILEEAKSKLDGRKVKMDKLIAELQAEKSKVEKLNKAARQAERKAKEAEADYEKRKGRFEDRLETQQTLIERNNKYLTKGKKMHQFITNYNARSKNKELLEEVRKYLAMEKAKFDEERKTKNLKEKTKAKKERTAKRKADLSKIEVGCTVKLRTGKQRGTVLEIEGKTATVAFGFMKTKVDLSKLDYVG